MLELQAANVLKASKSFPNRINTNAIQKLKLTSTPEIVYIEEVLNELEIQQRDLEIQNALKHALVNSKKSDFKNKIISFIGKLDREYNQNRIFWLLSKKGVIH